MSDFSLSQFTYRNNFGKTFTQFVCHKQYLIPCVIALVNVIATYIGVMYFSQDNNILTYFILAWNCILVFFFTATTIRQIYLLRRDSKKTQHGSLFRYRLILLFTLVAILPVLLLGLFSSIAFRNAAKGWFDDRVERAVYNAENVAEAYLNEHNRNIRADIFATEADLKELFSRMQRKETLLEQVKLQLLLRDLSSISLYNQSGQLILHTRSNTFRIPYHQLSLTLAEITNIYQNEPFLKIDKQNNLLNAYKIIRIGDKTNILHIARPVSTEAIQYADETHNAVSEYGLLKKYRHQSEIGFALIYTSFGLFVIILMVTAGHFYALQITHPLEVLTETALKIESGDETARCPIPKKIRDEIDRMSVAFNRMIDKLSDEKRLNQAVLSGVSTGVICLTDDRHVCLINQRALDIFKVPFNSVFNFQDLTKDFIDFPLDVKEIDMLCSLVTGEKVHLHIRCTVHESPIDIIRTIVTIDDISELMRVQSVAAWQDIAKRIAHEIKNPLTPIALATERIERKWGKEIQTSKETFLDTINIILKQVDHIKDTANSLAKFAKMPSPLFTKLDIIATLRDVIKLETLRNKEISLVDNLGDQAIYINGDDRLISQAFINIIKNAIEAIEQNNAEKGIIEINRTLTDKDITINVIDNGGGLPADIPPYKLFNPYVTNKEHGTGIGLAVTGKIISEHLGKITLKNQLSPETQKVIGVCAVINLPLETTRKEI